MTVRRYLVLAAAILLALICMLPERAYAGSASIYVKVTQNYKQAQKTLEYLNKERSKRGLRKLKLDKNLTDSAISRAAEVSVMIPYTSPHRRPNGKLVKTINKRICYECCMEGGDFTPAGAIASWMDSPSHKKGILLKSARSVGISCCTTVDGYEIWTLDFSNSGAKKVLKSTTKKTYTKKVVAKSSLIKKKYFKISGSKSMNAGKKRTAVVIYRGPKTFGPGYVANKSFKWSSSKKSVATVTKNGVIKAKKAGTVTIKAKLKSGSKFTISKKIKVKPPKLTLNVTTDYLTVGQKVKLVASGLSSTQLKKVTWSASDPDVVLFIGEETGKAITCQIQGITYKPVVITAKCGTKTAKCYLYTYYDEDKALEISKETLKKLSDWTVENGNEGVNDQGITYYSSKTRHGTFSKSPEEDNWDTDLEEYVYPIVYPDRNIVRFVYRRFKKTSEDGGQTSKYAYNYTTRIDVPVNSLGDVMFNCKVFKDKSYIEEDADIEYEVTGKINRETFQGWTTSEGYVSRDYTYTSKPSEYSDDYALDDSDNHVNRAFEKWDLWIGKLTEIEDFSMYRCGFPSMYVFSEM